MHKEDLVDYFNGKINAIELSRKIADELNIFQLSLKVKGKSAAIKYDGDSQRMLVESADIKKLCVDYLQGNVDKYFVSYIADALLLSASTIYEDEIVRDQLESLTDFEVNGSLSKRSVEAIYNEL